MRIAGIIAEYNPFHRGHAWHIAQTRRALGPDCAVVCAMSSHWVQRGECALTGKWARAAMALRGGADLVLEIPTPWACASAEPFARGGVGILTAAGVVDTLSFGSESGDLDRLRAAAACLDSEVYRGELRRFLDAGRPFAACRHAAVRALLGEEAAACLANPNDNLGVEYLRALPPGMGALAVPRMGVPHDGAEGAGGFASASAIRGWLRQGQSARAEPFLPEPWQGDIASMAWIERAVLSRLRSMTLEEAQRLPDSGEGLARRLLDAAREAEDLEGLYRLVKTKRYAHARVRRLALWAFLGLEAADRPAELPYLRVLGLTGRGRAVLREMGRRSQVPVVAKPAHVRRLGPEAQALFALEDRCTALYGLCFPRPRTGAAEWTTSPVFLP